LFMPTILTLIFGYAIGNPRVTGIRTRVLDMDGGRIAYEYVQAMTDSITFKPDVREHATEADVAQAEDDLLHDRINAFVVLPTGMSAALDAAHTATVRVVVDGSDTFMAPSLLAELGRMTVQQNAFVAAGLLERAGRARDLEAGLQQGAPTATKAHLPSNPDLKSQNFRMPEIGR